MSSLVTFSFENAGVAGLASGIATLGQVFLPGQLPPGTALSAQAAGQTLDVQMDVKTRYEDGSVKMAVLSVERPALAAGAALEVTLATAAPSQAAAIDLGQALAGHSFDVDLSIHGAGHVAVDVIAEVQKALAAGTASLWQQGELATQARVEIPLEGSQRLVFDVTAYQGGGFSVDAQFNNDGAMAGEGGAATYHLKVTMDGKSAFNDTISQAQYQNIHMSFASNATDGGQGTGSPEAGWLNIRQDVAQLQEAGVVAGYDLGLEIDPAMLAGFGADIQSAGWGAPLAVNGVTQYMPGTGGRADIGITTEANTAWLISQDPRAAAYALGQAETAGAVPWNFWDAANGSWLSTDDYPNLWTDGRGGTGTPGDARSPGLTQQVSNDTGWTTDVAHQPNLSFVPYVLTGERWILDNLQAQAAATILGQHAQTRGFDVDNVIAQNQVRGSAWALRELDNAAWASPEGSAERAYFEAASEANYAWLVSMIPEWTAQQGEAHGWVPGSYGTVGALPPWQQDYFASTVIAAASRGNEDAMTFLEWQSNFLVGRFTQASNGFDTNDGAAYLIAISDPREGASPYKTWAEIGAQTDARGWSNGDGWSQSQGDYAQLAAATLAGIYRLTGSAEAKAAYEGLIADAAPFLGEDYFTKDPTYALAAPGAPVGQPSRPVSPSLPEPTPPKAELSEPAPQPTPEADSVELAIVLGADSWNGHPIAIVRVDGQLVFHGEVSAAHGTGGARYELGSFAAGVAHEVTVEFVNDGWGGDLSLDRNLYVEGLLVDGVDTGHREALVENGQVALGLDPVLTPAPTPDRAPAPAPTPVPVPPSDTVELAVVLGADSWDGHPVAIVRVDGQEVFYGEVAASHATGGARYELGSFAAGVAHTVTVEFINNGWGGDLSLDRNLYVEALLVDGVDTGHREELVTNGQVALGIEPVLSGQYGAPGPAGDDSPDVLRVAISQDAYQGDAAYLLMIDGVAVGGERVAQSLAGSGQTDIIEILGDFAGGHELTVRFLNDAWGGSETADRNLYVEAVEFNGQDQHAYAALMQNGDAVFSF